ILFFSQFIFLISKIFVFTTTSSSKLTENNSASGDLLSKKPNGKDAVSSASSTKPSVPPTKSSAAPVKPSAAPVKPSAAPTKLSVLPMNSSAASMKPSAAPMNPSVALIPHTVAPMESTGQSATPSTYSNQTNLDYIKTSCNLTHYKTLCYISLSPYALKIDSNPQRLAVTALNLTLSSANSAAKFIKNIPHGRGGLTRFEAGAVADCVEEIGDSVSELQDSIRELESINYEDSSKFEMVMSDVETWVSAALTDDDTCMDGFGQDGRAKAVVKDLVRRHVVKVARLTSNALAVINMYASTHEK
ncbi:unnamed protein product, partial [Brassica rapa subsp. trilocularis]